MSLVPICRSRSFGQQKAPNISLDLLFSVALLLSIPSFAQQNSGHLPANSQPISFGSTKKPDSPVRKMQVECTPASRASELIGKQGCISGTVYRVTTRKDGSTHLNLCPAHTPCSFHAVVKARDHQKLGDLSYLHGRLVAIVGDITSSRGRPEIVIRDRPQIRPAATNPPPEFDAAQSTPSAKSTSGRKRARAW